MHRTLVSIWIGVFTVVVAVAGLWSPVSGQDNRAATGASLQLIDDLVLANRILVTEGILDGLGHISVRHNARPDRFFVSRDLAPSLVTAGDLIEYDLDANPTTPNAPRGYQERYIHAAIYKARPDVRSVIHAHTPSVVTFAVSNVPMRPMSHVADFLLPGVPTYEIRKVAGHVGMLVNDARTGAALAETLNDKAVALMRGHGYVVVGPDIPETVGRAIDLDSNARVQMQAIAVGGTVSYLTTADVASPQPASVTPDAPPTVYPRAWGYWKDRATRR